MTTETTATRKRSSPGDLSRPKISSPWGNGSARTGVASGSIFIQAFKADRLSVINTVKTGVSPIVLFDMADRMHRPRNSVMSTLGVAPATVKRKAADSTPLSSDDSSRVFGMARLIGQVESMVNESGDPKGFDAPGWVADWLDQPLPALGNRTPGEFMDTAEGQSLVSDLLAQSQSGAFA